MAKRKKKRIASRGSVNNIILKTLVNGDKYGYEIIKEVEEYSQGKISLKQPSLYSSLTRFEDKGFVSSYWGDSEIGGRRHYYHLTDKGMQYYKIHILKEDIDDVENNNVDIVEDLSSIDKDDNITDTMPLEEDNNDEILPIDNDIENSSTSPDEVVMHEVDENTLPAIVQFDIKEPNEVIPDHNFYTKTPIDNIIESDQKLESNDTESKTIDSNTSMPTKNNTDDILDIQNSPYDTKYNNSHIENEKLDLPKEIEYPWLELATNAKKSRDKVSNSPISTLYLKQRPKPKKVILDSDGIYKLRDADYVPTPRMPKQKELIIDNVGKRSNNQNTYSYTTYSDSSHRQTQSTHNEMTEEEKRRKNDNFVAKFNMLTMSRMKPVSTPIPQQPKEIKEVDYRGKLDNIIESNRILEEKNKLISEQNKSYAENQINTYEQNNLFNYVEENTIEEDEDKFIDFEPVEEFETKTESNEYATKISNFSNNFDEIKINRYETKSNAVLIDKTYILINKLRFTFGIILSILLALEVLITQVVLRNNGMIVGNDNTLFIIGYCIAGAILITTTIPLIISHNEHKCNNFKFRYAFWFGLLTFLVLTIIIYCVNALMGFELEYFSVFATKLILPIVLSFNFAIAPIIYYCLTKVPRFYD